MATAAEASLTQLPGDQMRLIVSAPADPAAPGFNEVVPRAVGVHPELAAVDLRSLGDLVVSAAMDSRTAAAAINAYYRYGLGCVDGPEDLISRTAERVLRSQVGREATSVNSMGPYFRGALVRVAISASRAARARPDTVALEVAENDIAYTTDVESQDGAWKFTGDVGAAVQALPTRQREIITLRHVYGYTVAEVAALLGITEGAVKSTAAKARDTLGAALQAYSHGRVAN